MARARVTYLSEAEKQFVHEQTVRVLEEVGVGVGTSKALDLLADAGAPVDREAMTAKIPWDLIERCLKQIPKRIYLAGRDPKHDRYLDDDEPIVFNTDGTATFMHDDLTNERREGSEADLRRVMRLYEGLDEVDMNFASICPRDIDPVIMGLKMAEISLTESGKHFQDEVRTPEEVPYYLEMLELLAGAPLKERPIFSVTNCTVAPLQHDGPMTEAHMEMLRAGAPMYVLPMPLTGTTGPITVLGTSIVNMAELLSAVVIFQLAAPGASIVSGIGAAAADLRNGMYLSGAPEAALINLICVEMSRFYGMRTMATAICSDSKATNQQCGAEGMMTCLAAALTGSEGILAFGQLDAATCCSIAKIVLDCDTVGAVRRMVREDPVDASTALFDDIREVGIGGHYLARKSTRRLRDSELWRPDVWQRDAFESYGGRTLIGDAVDKAEEIIAANVVTPVPDETITAIDALIAKFRATQD